MTLRQRPDPSSHPSDLYIHIQPPGLSHGRLAQQIGGRGFGRPRSRRLPRDRAGCQGPAAVQGRRKDSYHSSQLSMDCQRRICRSAFRPGPSICSAASVCRGYTGFVYPLCAVARGRPRVRGASVPCRCAAQRVYSEHVFYRRGAESLRWLLALHSHYATERESWGRL